MITSQADIQRAQYLEKDENQIKEFKKTTPPYSFSKLHERIPVSSYLLKRLSTSDGELQKESMPTRPMSANSALSFITDHEQKCQKVKNAPTFTLLKEINTLNTQIMPSSRRGTCLTNPNEPREKNGFDNVDGNLIVYENDLIQPQSKCTYLIRGDEKVQRFDPYDAASFLILHLLGQGTFAQVFKCEDKRTGKHVALKVIKNKAAYTNQALVEIEIFEALNRIPSVRSQSQSENPSDPFVHLLCYFMYRSHLCLVFELLGTNLYEILKRRQFRGLPLVVVKEFMKQALDGMNILSKQSIIHCDVKPENILLSQEHSPEFVDTLGSTPLSVDMWDASLRIKIIDFGSACFEGQLSHSYVQSRFYRSPEVILGVDYDSAIDVWSLGCVAAELLLGLPILPGMNEHDQLTRICEMIGNVPDWMIENGTKAYTHFAKEAKTPAANVQTSDLGPLYGRNDNCFSNWRLMSSNEYYATLSDEDKEKISKAKSTHRYFKRKLLGDIITLHGCVNNFEEKQMLPLFIHLLTGMLNIDPWSRLTSYQASKHPFLTGIHNKVPVLHNNIMRNPDNTGVSISAAIVWKPPWDASITRRKLLMEQKNRLSQSFGRSKHAYNSTANDNKSIRYANNRNRSQSNGFSLHGSHPNLYALHQASLGTNHSQICDDDSTNQQRYWTGTVLHPQLIHNAGYFPRADDNINAPHPDSNRSFSQSFSGVYYDPFHPIVPGDLGLALQRPGIHPLGGESFAQYESQNQLLRSHIPVNTLIKSGSSESLQGEFRQRSYRNRHSNIQRKYPSSYSDVYGGSFISRTLEVQPITVYDSIADYTTEPGIRKTNANSLLAQQLSDYSSPASQSSYQTSMNSQIQPHPLHILPNNVSNSNMHRHKNVHT